MVRYAGSGTTPAPHVTGPVLEWCSERTDAGQRAELALQLESAESGIDLGIDLFDITCLSMARVVGWGS